MGKRYLSSSISPQCLWDGVSLQFKENLGSLPGSKVAGVDFDHYYSPPLVPWLRMCRDISVLPLYAYYNVFII